jgi:hypothetical protein
VLRTSDGGSEVAALVYRHSDDSTFTVGVLFCRACRVEEVRHPTRGAAEYVVHARLGRVADIAEQRHWLAISDPEVVDSSRRPTVRASARRT